MSVWTLHHDPNFTPLLEKQMRNWEIARAQRTPTPADQSREVEDYVAISRMVGSGGGQVARMLGEKLGWPVFDREILQTMAGDDKIRRTIYESMDEKDVGWFEDALRSLMDSQYIRNDYFRRLSETVFTLARQSRAIFLGRSADLILPNSVGLRVRIVATRDQCLARFADRHHLGRTEAEQRIQQIEKDRTEFIWNHFHVPATDQTRHDLIINLQHCSLQDAVDLILTALRLRGIEVHEPADHRRSTTCDST